MIFIRHGYYQRPQLIAAGTPLLACHGGLLLQPPAVEPMLVLTQHFGRGKQSGVSDGQM